MKKNYNQEINLLNKITNEEEKFNIFIAYYELTNEIVKKTGPHNKIICYQSFLKTLKDHQKEKINLSLFISSYQENLKKLIKSQELSLLENTLNEKANSINYLQPSRVKELTDSFPKQAKFYIMIKNQLNPIEETLNKKFNLPYVNVTMKKIYTKILNSFHFVSYQNETNPFKLYSLVNERISMNIHYVLENSILCGEISISNIKDQDTRLYLIEKSCESELLSDIIERIFLIELISKEQDPMSKSNRIGELSEKYSISEVKIYSILRKLLIDTEYYKLKNNLKNKKIKTRKK